MSKKLKGEAAARQAYKDVLGREAENDKVVANWAKLGSYDRITRVMSLEPEARSRGVDPTAFGNKAIDPSTLKPKEREWYDAWAATNGGTFFDGHKELLGWHADFGTLDVYRGRQDGTIQSGPNGETIVTQAAVDRYGADNLKFSGSNQGDIIIAPIDSGIKVGNSTGKLGEGGGEYKQQWADQGYAVRATTGNVDSGIGGWISDKTGIDEKWTVPAVQIGLSAANPGTFALATAGNVLGGDRGAFIADPINMTSGVAGGQERYMANLRGGASITGMEIDDVSRAQGYGQAAVAVAASIVNPFAGAAISSAGAANRAAVDGDWKTAGITAATAFATAGVASMGLTPLQAAGAAGGIDAGATLAGGGSVSEAFENAAWAAGGSFAGSAVGAAAGFEGAAAQGLTSAGVSYGIQGLRTGDWSSAEAFANAALSGVGAWAQASQRQGANDRWRVNDGGDLETSPLTFGERMRGLWSPTGNAINIDAVRDFRASPPRRSSGEVFAPRDAGSPWRPPVLQFNPGVDYADFGVDWAIDRWRN